MANQELPERPAWSCADDESLSLMFSLLQEDALEAEATLKRRQASDTLSDAELALQLFTEDLNVANPYVSDRKMSKSMQGAVQTDTNALPECEREESMAQNDRQLAVAHTTGTPPIEPQMLPNADLSEAELNLLDELEKTYITGVENPIEVEDDQQSSHGSTASYNDGQQECSSWEASLRLRERFWRACVACADVKYLLDLARAPCEHYYCSECLESLFQNALLDESFFPPRCCRQEIPVDENSSFLSLDLIEEFEGRYLEFSTPNRTYCHQETCSAFIPPSMIEDGVAQCPECEFETCVTCKGATHQGDCPADEALQQVLEVAVQEGWQRCPQCSTMIELNHGCYHITCKCRAEFCYLCAAEWKTCECIHWEERRLYDRAQEIYDRDHNLDNNNDDADYDDDDAAAEDEAVQFEAVEIDGVNQPPPEGVANRGFLDWLQTFFPIRELEIERIMEDLRENHECDHERWRSRRGRHRCETCHEQMPVFIYECRQCRVMACRRCRYNRL
ncbi:hypothetical protein F4860DRAFT_479880 [Xylaria cubensis]|nr:hypothetical protein F4860DRAFT_479880 [Xylaria cubensis]